MHIYIYIYIHVFLLVSGYGLLFKNNLDSPRPHKMISHHMTVLYIATRIVLLDYL